MPQPVLPHHMSQPVLPHHMSADARMSMPHPNDLRMPPTLNIMAMQQAPPAMTMGHGGPARYPLPPVMLRPEPPLYAPPSGHPSFMRGPPPPGTCRCLH